MSEGLPEVSLHIIVKSIRAFQMAYFISTLSINRVNFYLLEAVLEYLLYFLRHLNLIDRKVRALVSNDIPPLNLTFAQA